MQRREFIGFIGGALAWPIATHAQQKGRIPSLGVIIRFSPTDPEAQERVATVTNVASRFPLSPVANRPRLCGGATCHRTSRRPSATGSRFNRGRG
jgi:hypothetical protein